MKVLINKCSNGFSLSEKQKAELFPETPVHLIPRHDGALIASFEAGDRRGNGGSSLAVVEIPDGAVYKIVDRDGYETLYWSESPINEL
jgi:hypothetical protein